MSNSSSKYICSFCGQEYEEMPDDAFCFACNENEVKSVQYDEYLNQDERY